MDTTPKNKTACIIGGGFAGLSAAVFLDSLGYKVSLFEKKPVLGGRAYSFLDRKTGEEIDNGQHLLMGAYHETIRLMELIGAKRFVPLEKPSVVPIITTDEKLEELKIGLLPAPLNLLKALVTMGGFSWLDKWNFFCFGLKLKKLKSAKSMDSVSGKTVEEWLTCDGKQSVRAKQNFWDLLTLATLNESASVCGASYLAEVLVRGFVGSTNDSLLIVPGGTLNELLARPASDYLELRGQTVTTGVGAKKIHILDQKVQAVELDNGEMVKADVYVSTVPFARFLNLIPDGFLNLDYFEKIKKMSSSPILSVNLWFDREIFEQKFIGLANGKIHWYFNKNKIHKKSAAPYHVVGVISGAGEYLEKSRDEIVAMALAEMSNHFPKMKEATLIHALVNKEREATFTPTPESVGLRPSQKSPFENLFVAGDWTDTKLPATIESAVLSARLAVDFIDARS